MLPKAVPSISMAVILVPISGRDFNAFPPQQANSPLSHRLVPISRPAHAFSYFIPRLHAFSSRRARSGRARTGKRPPERDGLNSCSPFIRRRMLADVGDLLGFRLASRQQHDLPIGELERVMAD